MQGIAGAWCRRHDYFRKIRGPQTGSRNGCRRHKTYATRKEMTAPDAGHVFLPRIVFLS
jgi:hypothetical protein